jgi:hypothetical protein
MNNKFLRLWKEAFTATFKVLSKHSPGQEDQARLAKFREGTKSKNY